MLNGEHEWFRNYLQNRIQIVEFQDVSSAAEPVSVRLSPAGVNFSLESLLFILHLNDLPSDNGLIHIFSVRIIFVSYMSRVSC